MLLVVLSAAEAQRIERLKEHVYTLASDSLLGRKAGSPESEKAARYIENEWREIGLASYNDSTYHHHFMKYKNLVAVIEGQDERLKDEYILLGAHYDHIGFKVKGNDTIIYNGADDNASGAAALIEVARELLERQSELKRSVIIAAFDAEEIGLIGSTHFVKNKLFPLEDIKLMMSIDMVGWYRAKGAVIYSGVKSFKNGDAMLKSPEIVPQGLNVKTESFERNVFVATDTQPFAAKGIPTLAVTTGLKSPYHKPEDEAHLIDYEGMDLIVEHLTNLTVMLSNENDLTPTGKLAPKHRTSRDLIELALTANIGSNSHYYTAGAVDGKLASSSGVGLGVQLNMGSFALRPELFYDWVNAKHPEGHFRTNNLTIPMNLVLQSGERMGSFDFFAGPYYRYRLKAKVGEQMIGEGRFRKDEWGINYGVRVSLGPFIVGATSRSALTNLTFEPNVDGAHLRNRSAYLTLGFRF